MGGFETAVQIGIVSITLSILFYLLQTFIGTTSLRTKLRTTKSEANNKHFVTGARLLTRARRTSTNNRSKSSLSLAKEALSEADKALLIDPKDAASHILRALSLELLGRPSLAVKSLDAALCSPSLSDRDRGDALLKRAQLRFAVSNKRRRVDEVIDDVAEAVRLGAGSEKAYCLRGECYEVKGMREKAREAFQEALRIEPGSVSGRQGLEQNI